MRWLTLWCWLVLLIQDRGERQRSPPVQSGLPLPPLAAGMPSLMLGLASLSVMAAILLCMVTMSLLLGRTGGPAGLCWILISGMVLSTTSDTPRKRNRPGQKSDPSGHLFAAWDTHEWCPSCRISQGHNCTEQKPCPISSNWTLDMWARLSKSRTYKSRASSAAGRRASSVASGVSASARSTSSQAASSASGVSRSPFSLDSFLRQIFETRVVPSKLCPHRSRISHNLRLTLCQPSLLPKLT